MYRDFLRSENQLSTGTVKKPTSPVGFFTSGLWCIVLMLDIECPPSGQGHQLKTGAVKEPTSPVGFFTSGFWGIIPGLDDDAPLRPEPLTQNRSSKRADFTSRLFYIRILAENPEL
ncbi:hypothetical protein EVJ10_23255 [Salmonella enterica subsp. enterica serovar Kottbus]|nr:hypothetical protein [Salmonella enterica subsp. enterica serovar Kottbus]